MSLLLLLLLLLLLCQEKTKVCLCLSPEAQYLKCLCYRRKMLEDDKYNDEKERIRQRSADRRAERQAKSDEIKRKYGE